MVRVLARRAQELVHASSASSRSKLRPREQGKEELAHYSIGTTDIEYLFPFSDEPQELEGVAHRGDYDLTQHMKHSGKDLTYFDEELWAEGGQVGLRRRQEEGAGGEVEAAVPLRAARDRAVGRGGPLHAGRAVRGVHRGQAARREGRACKSAIVMQFHPRLAPIKAAILPLVNKDGMPEIAEKLYRELKQDWNVFYDDGGAVGRRYRRQDEVGTPFCITIDGETLQDQTVTIRDRDTLKQERIPLDQVAAEMRKRLNALNVNHGLRRVVRCSRRSAKSRPVRDFMAQMAERARVYDRLSAEFTEHISANRQRREGKPVKLTSAGKQWLQGRGRGGA